MPGPFDSAAKRLLREKPEHYVKWLVDQATFVRQLPTELKSRNVFADGLFFIKVNGKPELLHIEFQTRNDPNMGKRLLEYNILASSENDWLPVYTVVIYLRRGGMFRSLLSYGSIGTAGNINDFIIISLSLRSYPQGHF